MDLVEWRCERPGGFVDAMLEGTRGYRSKTRRKLWVRTLRRLNLVLIQLCHGSFDMSSGCSE
jgi:hypothetical protein